MVRCCNLFVWALLQVTPASGGSRPNSPQCGTQMVGFQLRLSAFHRQKVGMACQSKIAFRSLPNLLMNADGESNLPSYLQDLPIETDDSDASNLPSYLQAPQQLEESSSAMDQAPTQLQDSSSAVDKPPAPANPSMPRPADKGRAQTREFKTEVLSTASKDLQDMGIIVDELLGADDADLPSRITQQIDKLLSVEFVQVLKQRVEQAPSLMEREQMSKWAENVLSYIEAFVEETATLAQQGASPTTNPMAKMEGKLKEKRQDLQSSASPGGPSKAGYQPDNYKKAYCQSVGTVPQPPTQAQHDSMETSLKQRSKLERLLAAAKDGIGQLDEALDRLRDASELDTDFLRYLEWEVGEQVKMKNERILYILEIIIQRVCLELEAGQEHMQLLSEVLMLRDRQARRECLRQNVPFMPPDQQQAFEQAVLTALFDLRAKESAGQAIDPSLVGQMKRIAEDMQEFLTYS